MYIAEMLRAGALFIGVVLVALVLVAFSRALTARLCTGKWPHQSQESLRIYRRLP